MQCRSGPWFPTGVTSKKKLLILPHHLSSPAVVSGVCVARSFVFCVVVCRSLFVHFLLTVVFSFLLRFTSSDYSFGIFKLLLFSCCYQLLEMRGVCIWLVAIGIIGDSKPLNWNKYSDYLDWLIFIIDYYYY